MKRILFTLALILGAGTLHAQDSWKLEAGEIDPDNYYGVSVSNGKIGMVSSPDPLKIRETVVAGLYDIHGAGRVESTVRSFNLLVLSPKGGFHKTETALPPRWKSVKVIMSR